MMICENTPTSALAGIRLELKKWEKSFADAHQGRKPGRDDIKQDASIAAKYREYDRLRGRMDKLEAAGPREKGSQLLPGSPRRSLRDLEHNAVTPRKARKSVKEVGGDGGDGGEEERVEEAAEVESTPAYIRCALGPTPQRDGHVLGIFDLATPSRTPTATGSVGVRMPTVNATPSKQTASLSSELKPSRTPQTSATRFYLDAFASTPAKRKREDEGQTPSTAKRQYATPSFLRRSFPLASIAEHDEDSMAPPFRKRGLVRSLSTIIQGLRKQEEERMDDDWDILNQIEEEERGAVGRDRQSSGPKILVQDSQVVEMPLGPDQAAQGSDDDRQSGAAQRLDHNGQPRKPWKKKGLKRQTRRVIMRPVLHKSQKAGDCATDDDTGDERDAVVQTQPADIAVQTSLVGHENGENEGCDDSDAKSLPDEPLSPTTRQEQQKKKKSRSGHSDKVKAVPSRQTGDQDSDAKKTKKINPLAHTNFRKLNIKNKNSKANGRGRKFGRR